MTHGIDDGPLSDDLPCAGPPVSAEPLLGVVEQLLWVPECGAGRGPKRSLTLRQIAAATVRIADSDGLGAVSMQRVAADLGVTKMALYRYLPGKTELLALTVEEAVEEPPDLSGVPGGWRPRLETWARLLRDVWQRHPWLPAATVGDRSMGPREVGWIESALATLAGTTLPPRDRLDAVLLLCGLLRTTSSAGAVGTQPWTISATNGTTLQTLISRRAQEFPALLAALPDGARRPPTGPAAVLHSSAETGLRLLFDGMQAAMDRCAGRSAPTARPA